MKKLTRQELDELSKALDILEAEVTRSMGYKWLSGAFVQASMSDYGDEIIDITLIHGVQDDVTDTVHTSQLEMDRKTFEIID